MEVGSRTSNVVAKRFLDQIGGGSDFIYQPPQDPNINAISIAGSGDSQGNMKYNLTVTLPVTPTVNFTASVGGNNGNIVSSGGIGFNWPLR